MPELPPFAPLIAVIGAGMAGLAAARELQAGGARAVVFESTQQVGGKLRRSEVGGLMVDEGADSMLRRLPYGVDLATDLGLELTSPTTGAGLWTRGRVRPMPLGTVMGIPAHLRPVARSGVLSRRAIASAAGDLLRPGTPLTEDIAVGALVSRRVGQEITQRLVDPLLGGVYAGHADQLSLQMTLPQLWATARQHGSLVRAARAALPTPGAGPVFAGLAGGLGQLPDAAAKGLDIRLGAPVTSLSRHEAGWLVTTREGSVPVSGVVVAVPAAPAARLLAGHASMGELGAVGYASVGIVTLVLDGATPGTGTGYLVPAVERRLTKAVTFTSRKWLMAGPCVVRASVGRFGEEGDLQRDDHELVTGVLRELEEAVGPLPLLVDSRVTRWGGALPQYAVGHVDLVRRLRQSLPDGLAVAGAAYDGVGVPAVIRSGQEAARTVLAGLG
ncbi:MAG: protoporphyrinogen oxidase [Frankiales bacterium]|nr:protoporphyrinogen oxidase [Frankiales bacterium]